MEAHAKQRLIIHATNIHHGGGAILLSALFDALPDNLDAVAQIDQRMSSAKSWKAKVDIRYIKPTLIQRSRAERWLAKTARNDDLVLCFGNLPPLFKVKGRVFVFVQNRYLIDNTDLRDFSIGVRLRILIERLWLSRCNGHCSELIVQTPTMKRLLEKRFGTTTPIHVLPFLGQARCSSNPENTKEEYTAVSDFVYVASGEPHKNHSVLIEAWRLLAQEGLYPSLKLTLDPHRYPKLSASVDHCAQYYGLTIENLGHIPHERVPIIFRQARALIYPSILESFGIPLLEAKQAGLAILAPELDYVRDLLDPDQTFDPTSPVSIARAVKRFLSVSEQRIEICEPQDFVRQLLAVN